MTQVFLTSASVSPWSLPGDWTNSGHQVELVGCGGNGGIGTTGASAQPNTGGSGGGYLKLTSPSGTLGSTTAFAVKASNTSNTDKNTNATFWEGTTTTNTYQAECGLGGPSTTVTSGPAGGTGKTNGTPSPVTYTTTARTGGSGGAFGSFTTVGAGGGGGGAGPDGNGASAGTYGASSPQGGSGGGGGNGGTAGSAGVAGSGSGDGGAGGNGVGGSGGGTGGAVEPGGAGSVGGGGGGSQRQAVSAANSTGGAGGTLGNVTNWLQNSDSSTAGAGGGGGGSGGNTVNSGSFVSIGGAGANYGGGAGGSGAMRKGTCSSATAGGGLIVITYTPVPYTRWGWDQHLERMEPPWGGPKLNRAKYAGAIARGDDGTQARKPRVYGYSSIEDSQDNPLYQRLLVKRGALRVKYSFALFDPWVNFNWEVQSWQPPYHRYKPPTLGDPDGIDAPFVPPVPPPVIPLNFFDIQDAQDNAQGVPKTLRRSATRGSAGYVAPGVPWVNLGFDLVDSQGIVPKVLRRTGIRGSAGYIAPPYWVNNFDIWSTHPDKLRGHYWLPTTKFFQSLSFNAPVDPPPLFAGKSTGADKVKKPHKGGGAKDDTKIAGAIHRWHLEIEAPFNPFVPSPSYQQVTSQEFYLLSRYRQHARGHDGTDAVFTFTPPVTPVNFFDINDSQDNPLGKWLRTKYVGSIAKGDDGNYTYNALRANFDVIDAQDILLTKWFNDRGQRFGALARGDDGTEAPFFSWRTGWEVQPPQPPHPRYKQPNVGDIFGTDARFVPWQNFGWEQAHALTRYRLYKSPDVGDTGTENTYTFIPLPQYQFIDWPALPMHPQPKPWRGASFMRGDDGTEAPFINWFNAGWEVQPPQPPHLRYKNLDVGDPGIENTFTFIPLPQYQFIDWPAPSMHPQPKPWRGAAWMRGHDGTDRPFVNWLNAGWEVAPHQPQHRWFKSPETGDTGTEAKFVPWQNLGWEPAQAFTRYRLYRSPDVGDSGIENTFSFIPPPQFKYIDWPAPPHHSQPKPWRGAAWMRGDDGNEAPFIFVPPVVTAAIWAFDFAQVNYRRKFERSAVRTKHFFAVYPQWINLGWEQVHAQPQFRLYHTPDIGDPGIENAFVFVPPPQIPYTDLPAPPVHYHRKVERGALRTKDAFALFPQWVNLGGEQTHALIPHSRFKTPDIGDSGTQGLFQAAPPPVVPLIWWGERPNDPARVYQNLRGAIFQQFGFLAVPITPFAGFTQVHVDPIYRAFRAPERGHQLGGANPDDRFVSWVNLGFEQVHALTRYKLYKSPDIGESGIENPYVPPPFKFIDWPAPPMHPRPKPWRGAAWMRGDDGTEAPFVNWRNVGWEVQPPPPPSPLRRWEQAAAWMRGIDGIEQIRIITLPDGWEIQPWQPPSRSIIPKHGAIMIGDSGVYDIFHFVPPPVAPPLHLIGLLGVTAHVGRSGYSPDPNP